MEGDCGRPLLTGNLKTEHIQLIRPCVSTQYRLVTDGHTYGQTYDDSKYRAIIASRSKNAKCVLDP